MPEQYTFSIEYSAFLGRDGHPIKTLPNWANDTTLLTEFYRSMVLTRTFDQKAIALQRTGQLGTYASSLGQEAIGTAIAHVMNQDDILVPYYRDYSAQFQRGVKLSEILQYWGGDERGSQYQNNQYDLPMCVPIATQTCHAAGVAAAVKFKGEQKVVICTCGDGATSKGDFFESLNIAGVWHLPVIYVINNNQWAISVPRNLQCCAQTLAQKSIGAGIHGEQVDGNDIIALVESLSHAVERARSGKGASLIEAISYRLCDHTTADDASRYRSNEELNQAWQKEPIKRLQTYLHNSGAWDETKEQSLQVECTEQVQQAVDDYLNIEPQPPEAMFDYLYAELPASLTEQRDTIIKKHSSADKGNHHD